MRLTHRATPAHVALPPSRMRLTKQTSGDQVSSPLRLTIVVHASHKSLTASIIHSNSSEAPTRLVVFLGQRTSDEVPDAVPSGQYDPTGHLFWAFHVSVDDTERCSGSAKEISNRESA